MRNIITVILLLLYSYTTAQNSTASNIIEGGRTLVDLIRVIRTPKMAVANSPIKEREVATDSCTIKNIADVGYKNISGKTVMVSLYKRNNNLYATVPLNLKIANNSQEFLYEIQAGIYKYKIEYEEMDKKIVYKEGEIKIQPCEKLHKEITKE